MAQNPFATLPPELAQQQSQINRQQQLANLLMQQGMQQPQSQIVGGRYVPPSVFQNLANLANIYVGQKKQEDVEQRQLNLAKNLRQYQAEELGQYQEKLATDPQSAYLFAATAANPILQQIGIKKLDQAPQWKEISKYNPESGNTETYRYDANAKNPTETMQFLGISKPALSTSDIIKFRDEGIPIPQQFLGSAVGQPVSPSSANVSMTTNQPAVTSQISTQTPSAVPTVSGSKEYNPFIAPPVPLGLSGKQAREWKSEQAKPLTGESEKQVSGAINYQKSLNNLQDIFGKYKGADLLNPNVRAEIQQSLNNALLQGKEANRLGVLNGPDLSILEKIVGDPTAVQALIKDRSTINKLYDNQRMFTAEVIKTNYRSAQKAVPENLREFVEIKPRELPSEEKKGQPRPTGAVARAMLNGRSIVVRNGQWVDEKTGQPVQ